MKHSFLEKLRLTQLLRKFQHFAKVNINYYVHNSPSRVPIMSPNNSVLTLPYHFLKLHFHTTLYL